MSKTLSPFFVCVTGFLAGVFLGSFVDWGWYFILVIFICAVALASIGLFFSKTSQGGHSPKRLDYQKIKIPGIILSLSFFLLAFAGGIFRYDVSLWHKTDPRLDALFGRRVLVGGIIGDDPKTKIDSVGLVFDMKQMVEQKDNIHIQIQSRAIFSIKPYAQIYTATQTNFFGLGLSYGDEIEVSGTLVRPKPFDTGNGVFDYPDYLALNGVYYQIFYPKVKLISHGHGNPIKAELFYIKKIFMSKIERALPEPQSALLEAILLGDKQTLGVSLEDDFRRAGVIHVVILSGYSIAIISGALIRLCSSLSLSRFGKFFVASLGISLFAIMTGGTAMVTRASIMAILVLAAQYFRRDYDIVRGLALTVFIMILYNPKTLVFDSSFQISLISVIGLVYVAPSMENRLSFVTEKWGLRETLVSTLSTQIFVLPFILYQMGQVSLVGVPVNILILFCLPMVMVAGALAGVLSFIHPFTTWPVVAWPFVAVSYFILKYILVVVEFFSHLPFASMQIAHFSGWAMLSSYILYGALYCFISRKRPLDVALPIGQ